jgi:hypothetical protein
MIEIIVTGADGAELLELGRRFHDSAPSQLLVDGIVCEFVRFKEAGVALYRRVDRAESPGNALQGARREEKQSRLVAQIVRIADGAPVGVLDLETIQLTTADPALLAVWQRFREEGVRCGSDRTELRPLSRTTLSDALLAIRSEGFDWRCDVSLGPPSIWVINALRGGPFE